MWDTMRVGWGRHMGWMGDGTWRRRGTGYGETAKSKNSPGTLEAVNGQKVDAQLDSALGVADSGALMQHRDARLLELGDDRPGAVTRRLDNTNALINDGLRIGIVYKRLTSASD